uniref:C2H2-type domain-containing protein n=1 Tax=Timema shepardi TaxID=629360 RepID=A0A7R9G2T1_TIMSH|nr:unnamed protein product [Timema shepardi]
MSVCSANQKAVNVANFLVDEFISKFCLPTELNFNQARNFDETVIEHLFDTLGIVNDSVLPNVSWVLSLTTSSDEVLDTTVLLVSQFVLALTPDRIHNSEKEDSRWIQRRIVPRKGGVSEYQCMTCDWRSLHFESYLEHKETVQHQIKEKMETAMEEDINGEEAVDDDCVDENEDDFFCNLCNVDSTSRAEAEKHIKSAAHQNELSSSNSEDEYRYHLASSSHKKNVEEIAEDNIQYLPKNLTTYECHYCALVCSTKNEYESHLLSNTHKMHMASLKVSLCTMFKCEICNLQYSTYQEFSSHQYSTKHRLTIEPKDVYSMPQQQDFALVDTSPQYINRRKESPLHKLENHTFRELDHLRVSKCQQLVSGDEDLWERRAAPAENRDQQFSFRAERMLVHKGAQPLAQAQSTSAVVPSPQYVSFEEFSFSRERQAILEHAHSQ